MQTSYGHESELARVREEVAEQASAATRTSARLEAFREMETFVQEVLAGTGRYQDDRQAKTILARLRDKIRAEHQSEQE